MSILALIIGIVVVGLILWAINSFIPMEPRIKQILNIVVIVVLVIWILKALGVFAMLSGYRI
jgi:hypothetical protein